MNKQLTKTEQRFYKMLKKAFMLTRISIKTKISIEELCNEQKNIVFFFGNEKDLVKDVVIDFVLYRNNKAFAGIEIIDEDDELNMTTGEKLLVKTIFRRLGYEFFTVTDPDKLKEATEIIKEKSLQLIRR